MSRLTTLIGERRRPGCWRRPRRPTQVYDSSPWTRGHEDAQAGHHRRLRARRRRHRRAGRRRDRRPVVRLRPGRGDRVRRARTRRACAMPGCCRCSSISPATATVRATRTPAASVTPPLDASEEQRPGALPDVDDASPGRGDGRAPAGARADGRRRPGQPEPAAVGPAAHRRLRRSAVRRAGVHRRPVQHGGHRRTGTASPRRCCKALQAGADVALWVTTDEVPAVLDRLEKAVNVRRTLKPATSNTSLLRVAALKGHSPKCVTVSALIRRLPGRRSAMAGGTKRLPRAVREQQMLDAAVQMFSGNGYHETSMDAIAGGGADLQADAVPVLRLQGRAVRGAAWTARSAGSSRRCAPTSISPWCRGSCCAPRCCRS